MKKLKVKHPYILYYFVYSILFIFIMIGVFYPFYNYDKIMAWVKDAPSILYPAFSYLGNFLKESVSQGTFSFYNLSLGLGNDIFSFLGTWYLEPLSFLSFFIPENYYEEAYLIIIIFRFYLAGISFSIYSLYMKNRPWPTLLASFVYTFSVYSLVFGVKWPVFLMPMIYLPLLFIGIEKIIKKQTPFVLIIGIFISAWTSYFYLYINTLMCIIYFLLRMFAYNKNIFTYRPARVSFIKKSIISIFSYLLGIGMASIVLIPNIYVFINSNRALGAKQSVENMLYYGKGWLGGLLKYTIAPVKLWAYSPLPEFDLFIGIVPITIISVIILFFNKKITKYWNLKLGIIIMGLFLLIPFFAYIFSGFNVINHRWAYSFILLITFIFAKLLPSYNQINRLTGIMLVLYGIGYSILVYREERNNIYVQIALVLLIVSLIWVLCSNIFKLKYIISMIGISIITISSLFIFSNYIYSEDKGNMLYEYVNKNELSTLSNGTSLEQIKKIKDVDNSLFRIDEGRTKREGLSASALNNYYGSSFYNNVMSKNTTRYMQLNSNAGLRENILCLGYDSRTYLEEIAGVKYYIPSEEEFVPYGYTLNEDLSSENKKIYENKYALPIGFMYTDTISEEEYEKMDVLERQEVMLKALVLDKKNTANSSDYTFHSEKIASKISDYFNVNYSNKRVTLNNDFYSTGGYIELEVDRPDNAELYVVLEGINIDDAGFADWSFNIEDIECNKWKEKSILSNYNTYNPGITDYYINLGYEKNGGKHHIRIHFPTNACDFSLENISIYSQSFDNYNADVNKLQQNILENIKIDNDVLTGTITADTTGWLYLSIPYSKGWTAYVDNQKTDISIGNIMYMAIPLEKGLHVIQLEYKTPGLSLGIFISSISLILFLFMITRKYRIISKIKISNCIRRKGK